MTNIKGKSLAPTEDRTPDYPVRSLVIIAVELSRLKRKLKELNLVSEAVIMVKNHHHHHHHHLLLLHHLLHLHLHLLLLLLLLLLLALQPTMCFSLLSDSLPFCSFFTLLSPPSYSHYLHIFFNIYNPPLPWSPSNSRTYRFPL